MKIYVNVNAGHDGDGTKERPFRHINDAAKTAMPGDEVLVAPGIYREYVNPVHAGTEEARIIYHSTEPLGAVITGAEQVDSWEVYQGNVWVCRIRNSIFGSYNPYTTLVYGDWYSAKADKHTGCVNLNDRAMYEAVSLEECIKGEVYECSWVPEESVYKWYTEQDEEKDETVIYGNFQGKNPNEENVEINVRRMCFMPSETGIGYITVSGFNTNKAATTWAPPAAFQDGMMSQDIFVEVSHGPTLIDNNIMLSEASVRFATQGVAMVDNLICGALTCVGAGTTWRYTPYHIPHRTEVMGFMTFLHGDDRFYNNIFVQKWHPEEIVRKDASGNEADLEKWTAGTWMFDEYPTYEEWISQFDFTKPANMRQLEEVHLHGHLSVWMEGNVYLGGAKACKNEKNGLTAGDDRNDIRVELVEKEGGYYLDTNIYDFVGNFTDRMINTDVLGEAFEPEQRFENPDGTPIQFDTDYFGAHRDINVIPGPFAGAGNSLQVKTFNPRISYCMEEIQKVRA